MELHVAYSTDDGYAMHAGVSMISLFENNADFKDIIVHILDNGIAPQNQEKLIKITRKFNRKVFFYETNISDNLGVKIDNSEKEIAMSSYGRIFLPSILNKVEKVIYMDCDSIISGSFYELWNKDISSYSIAGVLDNCLEAAKEKIGLSLNEPYINAGFMLMNLAKIREKSGQEKMIEFIKFHNGDVYHHDQGVINGVFKNDILILNPKYNVMTPFFDMDVNKIKSLYHTSPYYSQEEIDEAKDNAVFVHFTPSFSKRPWIKGSTHPLKGLYHHYLEHTPWNGYLMNKDARKLRIKILEIIYKFLPFSLYKKTTVMIQIIKKNKW